MLGQGEAPNADGRQPKAASGENDFQKTEGGIQAEFSGQKMVTSWKTVLASEKGHFLSRKMVWLPLGKSTGFTTFWNTRFGKCLLQFNIWFACASFEISVHAFALNSTHCMHP